MVQWVALLLHGSRVLYWILSLGYSMCGRTINNLTIDKSIINDAVGCVARFPSLNTGENPTGLGIFMVDAKCYLLQAFGWEGNGERKGGWGGAH